MHTQAMHTCTHLMIHVLLIEVIHIITINMPPSNHIYHAIHDDHAVLTCVASADYDIHVLTCCPVVMGTMNRCILADDDIHVLTCCPVVMSTMKRCIIADDEIEGA